MNKIYIDISEVFRSIDDIPDALRKIAEEIEAGELEGSTPYWEVVEN